jgi:hypothetical protein
MPRDIGDTGEIKLCNQAMLPRPVLKFWRAQPLRDQRLRDAEVVQHVEGGRVKSRRPGFVTEVGPGLEYGHWDAMPH